MFTSSGRTPRGLFPLLMKVSRQIGMHRSSFYCTVSACVSVKSSKAFRVVLYLGQHLDGKQSDREEAEKCLGPGWGDAPLGFSSACQKVKTGRLHSTTLDRTREPGLESRRCLHLPAAMARCSHFSGRTALSKHPGPTKQPEATPQPVHPNPCARII